ncbi:preprotein translocase subunit YajC, partial [Telmatospirillum sp.]|uniref:preprotein translocase subunit YajC n=1 Tax=Telmatospirillum sp. TaxID=2079197 RepID=UPI00283FF009
SAIKRGDRVVTGGGILATVSKPPKGADDREIEVELAPGMKVIVLRETITAVIAPPKAANDVKSGGRGAAAQPQAGGIMGLLKGLLGKKSG